MELTKTLSQVEQKYFELSSKIVAECGFELYDLEFVPSSSTLRVFIRDPKTNSAELADCVKVDRAFTEPCEELEWIPDNFMLEVSSPGIFRPLKTWEHFNLAKGDIISLVILGNLTEEQINGLDKKDAKGNKFRAPLKDVLEDKIILDINGHDLALSFDQIKKANLDPDITG